MAHTYTEDEKADILGMLRVALVNDFREKYQDLLAGYRCVAGDDFIRLVESLNPYSVDTSSVEGDPYINLYAKKVKKGNRLVDYTSGLNNINDVFDVEDYDEIWVEDVKVLVMTDNGWHAA